MAETKELFELAAQNSDYLRQQFQRLKKNNKKGKTKLLDNFCRKLREEWNISANMSDWALVDWLDSGRFKNIYEVKKLQAVELVETGLIDPANKDSEVEAALIAHLDQFYERRTIFDSTFQYGKRLKYLALNIGGPGIDKYGPYCAVVDREKARKYKTLAFIKKDSAVNYIKDGQVEIKQLERDLAVEECMPLLAMIKHESQIEAGEPGGWSVMLCCDDNYMEAITLDNIKKIILDRCGLKNLFIMQFIKICL
ncbi:MAG: hypothetical protein GY940_09185 [bacterium]|nr:hypothetical protein [bacterium]